MDEPPANGAEPFAAQCQALLSVSESISQHQDLSALFHDLAQRLPRVVTFDFLSLVLYDEARDAMRLHILESRVPTGVSPEGELPLEESPGGLVWRTQQPLLVSDAAEDERYPQVMELLRAHNVKSLCLLPLTTAQRRLGAMGFGSTRANAYDENDVEFLAQVARQVAVAVDNALNYRTAQSYQRELSRERDRLRVLLDVNNAIVSNLDLRELFAAISAALKRVMQHEFTSLTLYDAERSQVRLYALDFPESKGFLHEEMVVPLGDSPPGLAITTRKPLLLDSASAEQFAATASLARAEGLKSGCILPLIARDRVLGTLNVGSLRDRAFGPEDLELLSEVAKQVAIAVENALAYREIADLKEKLAEEKLYLEEEIRTEHNFEEIIGESPALKRVLKEVETVAPTGATVLIQGETGTGKEVIARAVHRLSKREGRTFVKVNCAAIPSGLLESELFGHERGAFTGAIAQKIGRFELANGGTLFLDEVGDIPLELQPKLLRALQEQEFERLGSSRTIRVDVRLVAATNRNLTEMVAEGAFRSDLYYRLNVFPIHVPPLRERREDIPLLVSYFAQKHARRMDKRIETIPSDAMDALTRWSWPGNVRELENVIERAVIVSQGSVLHVPLAELRTASAEPPPPDALDQTERAHILRVLRESNGVIAGENGAAARLGMKRTTLQSRMKKLGILKPSAGPRQAQRGGDSG